MYELKPNYDCRKSFYGKAIVENYKGNETLYSYDIKVVSICNGKIYLYSAWDYSQTTLRHVKEFLKQNGQCINSIKDIRNLIKSGEYSEI